MRRNAGQVGPVQPRLAEVGIDENRQPQVRTPKVRAGEIRTSKLRLLKVHAGEIGAAQVNAGTAGGFLEPRLGKRRLNRAPVDDHGVLTEGDRDRQRDQRTRAGNDQRHGDGANGSSHGFAACEPNLGGTPYRRLQSEYAPRSMRLLAIRRRDGRPGMRQPVGLPR